MLAGHVSNNHLAYSFIEGMNICPGMVLGLVRVIERGGKLLPAGASVRPELCFLGR